MAPSKELVEVTIAENRDCSKSEVEIDVSNIESTWDSINSNLKKIQPKGTGGDCLDSFGGIGLHFSQVNGGVIQVREAPEGYPAERAGIKKDDILISPPYKEIVGPVGSAIEVTVLRDYKKLTFKMVREKICID